MTFDPGIQDLAERFNLAPQEALLLAYLLESDHYVGLPELVTAIGRDPDGDWEKAHTTLGVVVHRLRRKLPPNSIINRRGYGFKADKAAVFG